MGKQKFNQLTREQHKRYGTFIKFFRDGFLQLYAIFVNTYPKKHPIVKASDQILSALDDLKSLLDDEVCKYDFHWEDNVECYYGKRHWRDKEDAMFEAIANLELPERKPFDLERLLDQDRLGLTDAECLEVYQVYQRLKAILNRSELNEKTLLFRAQFILQHQKSLNNTLEPQPLQDLDESDK